MGAGRRREERVPLALKVEYPDAAGLVHDYTSNISRGGTFILTTRELQPGTRLTITFSFPGLLTPLMLGCVVRWRCESPPEACGVGVEFEAPSDEARRQIETILGKAVMADPAYVARRLRVLIADDNPHVSALLREGLTAGGRRQLHGRVLFDFEIAADGRLALERLMRERFDMLLIDVYMPVMDGPSVIRELRAHEGTRRLPIIALSVGGASARDEALDAGADFFIGKPVRLETILATMRQLALLDRGA